LVGAFLVVPVGIEPVLSLPSDVDDTP
jgi:hypothetical protein